MRASGSRNSGPATEPPSPWHTVAVGLSLLSACGGSGGPVWPDFSSWIDQGIPGEVLETVYADPGSPDVLEEPGPIKESDRCFPDKDEDGFPIKGSSVKPGDPGGACPQGYTFLLTFEDGLLLDCDDFVPTTYPGALETCNGVDDDCDGLTDEDLEEPCTDNCGNPGESLCEDGRWTPCSVGGKECCEGDRKETVPCPPFDFVFVTDFSGSMTQSDPMDIRYQAVEIFVEQMDNDVGLIMGFNHTVKLFGYFTGDKDLLKAFIGQAKAAGPTGATDIDGALLMAFGMFQVAATQDVIVLLTDGHDTTEPELFDPAALKQQAETLGIRVFILGLGPWVNTQATR